MNHPQSAYLHRLRQVGDRMLLGVIGLLLVTSFALAPWYSTWREAIAIAVPAAAVTAWLVRTYPGELITRCTIASALMILTALHIYQTHGMIEVHFGVFVLLSFLLFYRDWIPVVIAAAIIALHHLAFDFLQRGGSAVWVFAENTGFTIVLVHAVYVVFESGLLVWMALRLRAEIEAIGCEPQELARMSRELARGNVDVAVPVESARPESLACAMQAMRDELQRAVRDTGRVLQSVAAGDLSQRVVVDAGGEFARLKDYVNRTLDFLDSFMEQQKQLIGHANAGDFGERCPTAGLAGYQLELAGGLNHLVISMDSFVASFGEMLAAVAKGDLTKQMPQPYAGSLEALRRDANSSATQLAQLVGRIRETGDAIGRTAAEIARGNSDLSSHTDEQVLALKQMARSIEELTLAAERSASSAANAWELSQHASQSAANGGNAVGKVVATMEEISESSGRIASIIGVIQDIAFQTNLLALNAAVEAARAGEHGRGFAVVAAEVRTLAGRSSAAAKEIKALIAASSERVHTGRKLVQDARATMQEIVDGIAPVESIVREIADASRNQSATVSRTMKQMNEVARQHTAVVARVAHAARDMTEEAETLRQSVLLFKLPDGDSPALAFSDAGKVASLRPKTAQ
ncbi:MAG: methyl-accepting chemotaxis protein [Gammaproteobacteria bacterium]